MCELFGFSSKEPRDIRQPLKEFFSHSVKHPHGWGLMNDNRGIIKEPVRATDSNILNNIIDGMRNQRTALAHIRLATVGALRTENCHPYSDCDISGREWTLIHNGTIYSGRFMSRYLHAQSGDTDSERLFMYMLDRVNEETKKKGSKLTAGERFALLDSFAAEVSPRNKLNLIIYDGEFMYAHKNMEDTLYYKQGNNSAVISTQPLDDGVWRPVPTTRLIVFKDGETVYQGEPHSGVFIPTLEYISFLDAMNI